MASINLPPSSYQPHGWTDPTTGALLSEPIGQVKAHRSGARFLALVAGTRGGKTKAAAVEFAVRVWRDLKAGKGRVPAGRGKDRRPRLHYWIVSPTAALLSEPKRYLYETIPAGWIEHPFDTQGRMWLRGDILIEAKTAEKPQNLVSVGLNGMWIDEAARVKSEAWQGNLRGRLSDFRGWCLFSSTPLGRNWLYTDIVKRAAGPERDPEFEAVAWTTADNPHIARSEIESARRALSPRYFKREYEASFDAFLGSVYDEWNEALHVIDKAPEASAFRQIVLAQDFGWTKPGCLLAIGDLGGRYVVLDEVYEAHKIFCDDRQEQAAGPMDVNRPRPTWVGEAKRLSRKWSLHQQSAQLKGDPAEPDKIFDLIRNGIPASGADNDVLYGIRQVATALHPVDGRPALVVMRHCKNLIREIREYVYGDGKNGDLSELPVDGQSDHALDALRYGMVELMRYGKLSIGGSEPKRGWAGQRPSRVIG